MEFTITTNRRFNAADHDNSAFRDANAAAALLNERLMAAGLTHDRSAAEEAIASCDPYIASLLTVIEE